mgnify:CR=1 FL=1
MKKNLLIILMSGIMLSPACADIQDPDSTEQAQVDFDVEVVTDKLSNPWGMAWLPDGRMLVTERAGDIRIVQDGKLLADKVQGFPEVYAQGQGGLMDIKLHPDYAKGGCQIDGKMYRENPCVVDPQFGELPFDWD